MKLFDNRWDGFHGIGRVSVELARRLGEFRAVGLGGRPSAPHDPWRLGAYLRRARPEFFFSPGYNAPAGAPCRFAFTVHDLNHLAVKENGGALKRLYYSRVLRPALHRASVVFTVSEFSRRVILEWSGLREDGLVALKQGVSREFRPEGAVYPAHRPYFLYVGNHKPHKNIERALAAFANSGLSAELDFLLTGRADSGLGEVASRLGIADEVRFLGAVSDAALASLYRGATALVLVSLYEGFGLPIIESMACGTPVVTSNVTAMPEVAAEAGILVDPSSVEEIAGALRAVAADQALRERLRAAGLARAAHYDWDTTAGTIREALRRRA